MTAENREALASLRIILAVAKADGRIAPEEEAALNNFILTLPEEGRPSLDSLLADDIILEEELAFLTTEESRKRVHAAASLIAKADGTIDDAEAAILERIMPFQGEDTLIGQVIGEAKDTLLPSRIPAIHDPEQRAVEVQEDRMKYAILAAVLGANPLPAVSLLTDIVVVGLQGKMVRDIGQYYGHSLDDQAVKSLMVAFTGSTMLRLAVNNLAKFVPGWGSLFGAATSFATTWAIGKVAERWFDSGGNMDAATLRATYEDAWKDGRRSYDAHKGRVEQAHAIHATAIQRLQEDLAGGHLTKEMYQEKLAALGEDKV